MAAPFRLDAFVGRGETRLIVGFFDLTLYTKWCERTPAEDVLAFATDFFALAGREIARLGGTLVKPIGDAGLFVFPPDHPAKVRDGLDAMRAELDGWLVERGYPGTLAIKLGLGPVAVGRVGAPGDERLDVYGGTVNDVALLEGAPFAESPRLKAALEAT